MEEVGLGVAGVLLHVGLGRRGDGLLWALPSWAHELNKPSARRGIGRGLLVNPLPSSFPSLYAFRRESVYYLSLMTSFLDKLFKDFDEKAARQELEMARRQAQSIQDLLVAWERWNEQSGEVDAVGRSSNGSTVTVQAKPANGRRGRAGRAVILEMMRQQGPDTEWTARAVREGLGLGEDADHGIQIALSRLKRSNDLERPRKGVYRLPQDRPND